MPVEWISTNYPGVRYYKHKTRMCGGGKDRYFAIRYQHNGKRIEEGLGWASEGYSVDTANRVRAELKDAARTGEGPTRLKEKRKLKKKANEKSANSFSEFVDEYYLPDAKLRKTEESYKAEKNYYEKWIEPIIGDLQFSEVSPSKLVIIQRNMIIAGKSPRTIQYTFAVISQIWTMARAFDFVQDQSPTSIVKLRKVQNQRIRYLNHGEASELLKNLKERSLQVHNMALMALHCGLRAIELFRLKWTEINIDRREIIVTGKGDAIRTAYMTDDVFNMLEEWRANKNNELVFPSRNGEQMKRISNAYQRAVEELKYNEGIEDDRQKVVFHTLRHTFASWHVEAGTDIYRLKTLMGHSDIKMTERYAHVSDELLQDATVSFMKRIKKKTDESSTKSQ